MSTGQDGASPMDSITMTALEAKKPKYLKVASTPRWLAIVVASRTRRPAEPGCSRAAIRAQAQLTTMTQPIRPRNRQSHQP